MDKQDKNIRYKCPTCKGRKYIPAGWGMGVLPPISEQEDDHDEDDQSCPTCGGTGMVSTPGQS